MTHYVLTEDHRVIPEADLLTWARWFEEADRCVGLDQIGPYRVSTVFLGLDHDFRALMLQTDPSYRPLIFETMIFDCSREETSAYFAWRFHPSFHFQRRYRSWDEATTGHAYAAKIAGRMLRWMEFRSARQGREIKELERLFVEEKS